MTSATAAAMPTFSRIAGDPALDLVNTVAWRRNPERSIERLTSYADVLRWFEQQELLEPSAADRLRDLAWAHPLVAERERRELIGLREAIHAAAYLGESGESIRAAYVDAIGAGQLTQGREAFDWALPEDLALPRRCAALLAVDLLRRPDLDRIRRCDDDECGWVFLDLSPRHNRRWCDSADCGNRNRVRAHYRRRRAAVDEA